MKRKDHHLCARQDYLPGHENEQHDLWFNHPIDQTREELRSDGQ
jgi:hypothetical protein